MRSVPTTTLLFTALTALSALALALTPAPARAGGVGLLATGGAHTERLYYYSNADADGNAYKNIDDYDQYNLVETRPNLGLGLNLTLGDRDDEIMGDCRFYWLMDAPQADPAKVGAEVPADQIVVDYRDTPRHLGIGALGLSWGLVGDPGKLQFVAIGHVGSAFITGDHTEFLLADLGPGVTYRATRQVQLFGDAEYQLRFRKTFSHSVTAFVGARYLFD